MPIPSLADVGTRCVAAETGTGRKGTTVYAPDTPETDGWERERHEIETGERERAGKKFKSSQSGTERQTERSLSRPLPPPSRLGRAQPKLCDVLSRWRSRREKRTKQLS